MGTEVALSFSALRAQLENEKSSLCKIDENIKKIVQTSGRFTNDRFNPSGDYSRGGPRVGGRNSFPEAGKSDDLYGKRKHETKTVFSRLSARVGDSDGEDGPELKRGRVVSAVCRELPTRAAVLRAQGDDEQARTRNRRIFGSLLGTLQKFKQEEIGLQNKEEKKAQVERKIEEQARQQKEKEQMERKYLFAERDQKKAMIKALEAKMGRVQEFERWETSQKSLGNHILTKAKPHIYWLPKKMNEKANEKLESSRKYHEKWMTKKRLELQDELVRIEQKCLRRGPGAKENDPATHTTSEDKRTKRNSENAEDNGVEDKGNGVEDKGSGVEDKGSKRDKFAMDSDANEKEESDGEDKHEGDVEQAKDDTEETIENKMDTNDDNQENIEKEETNITNGTEQTEKITEDSQEVEKEKSSEEIEEKP